jgi:hypothetical protein
MSSLSPSLVAASAMIIFSLGMIHLLYTFRGTKLHPRDRDLQTRLRAVSPIITRETTMWRAWIGFNASHSFGAILFGAVYAYLALAHGSIFFASPFLLTVGLLFLLGYAVRGRLYWFRIPFRGIVVATALYVVALIVR